MAKTHNLTELLGRGKTHELLVCVWDPTNTGTQPRGKQVDKPSGIWCTPTTGIWQTVWIEPVNDAYISSFRIVTDADNGTVTIKTEAVNADGKEIAVALKKDGISIGTATGTSAREIVINVDDPVLWTPENPFLYDLSIELKDGKKVLDNISSYTGIRKISLGKEGDDFTRLLLNNRFVWQNGPLDQGFWPDGIYTPPSLEAMVYDIEMTKKMGVENVRKAMLDPVASPGETGK